MQESHGTPGNECGPVEVISEDISCIHCGYNLRGMATEKLCPECCTLVSRSTLGNLLRFSDPVWVDKLRLGVRVKLWSILLGIVAGGVFAGSLSLGGVMSVNLQGGMTSTATVASTTSVIGEVLFLIVSIVGIWATFLITSQEPRIAMHEDAVTLRGVIRVCAVVSFVAGCLESSDAASTAGAWVVWSASLLQIAGLVVLFGELVYLRRLAVRIPDEKLTRSTSFVMWGLPVCFVGIVLSSVVLGMFTPGTGGQLDVAFVIAIVFLCVAVIALAVICLRFVGVLARYRKAFAEAATQSRMLRADELGVSRVEEDGGA